MSRALSGEETDRELSARLGKVHAVLFAGLGGPATVSPYESAYSGDGRLFQAPVSEMADLLRRHGVHVSQAWSEAPDHLAVELTLIARLLAGGHGDGADLAGRLRRWLPAFAEQCAARDSSGFWSGAAQVLVALLSAGCADDQECNVFFIPLTGGNNDRRHQT